MISDEGSAEALGEAGADVEVVHDGDELTPGTGPAGGRAHHAAIHPDLPPGVPNVGYLVGGRLFHPGDALTKPAEPVEVLAVPAGAPGCSWPMPSTTCAGSAPGSRSRCTRRCCPGPASRSTTPSWSSSAGGHGFKVLDDGKPVEL